MWIAFLLALVAYLIGSVSGSLMLGRWRGIDIRTQGSGNAGGTNALRALGWRFALAVVAIDIGKGALATWLALRFAPAGTGPWLVTACLIAAVAGHVWPVFHGLRGGKGVATLVGGLAVAWPSALLPFAVVWLLVLTSSGYVGLSSLLAGVSLLAWAAWQGADSATWGLAGLAAMGIAFTHRANIARLRAGNESRFDRVRIWSRLGRARTPPA